MNALLSTELLKIRTTHWPLALVPVAAALTAAMALSPLVKAGTSGAPSIGTVGAMLAVVGATRLGAVVALVAGALCVTGEERHDTLTPTLLQAPARGRLLAAKAAAAALLGLAMSVADLTVVLVLGLPGGAIDLGLVNGDIAMRAAGLLAAYPLYAVLGVGIGALVVYQPVAIVVPVAWLLFLENLLVPAGSAARPWTPGEVSAALANAGDVVGLLPVWAGGPLLAGYALAATGLGGGRLARRDIT